mmetsp:Transcript_16569/g.32372  ORF Transcript_16569/g.32372 Transcript_16569/m.32372 type:complete len:254 (+) Transcript_16569:734-1495(+)
MSTPSNAELRPITVTEKMLKSNRPNTIIEQTKLMLFNADQNAMTILYRPSRARTNFTIRISRISRTTLRITNMCKPSLPDTKDKTQTSTIAVTMIIISSQFQRDLGHRYLSQFRRTQTSTMKIKMKMLSMIIQPMRSFGDASLPGPQSISTAIRAMFITMITPIARLNLCSQIFISDIRCNSMACSCTRDSDRRTSLLPSFFSLLVPPTSSKLYLAFALPCPHKSSEARVCLVTSVAAAFCAFDIWRIILATT